MTFKFLSSGVGLVTIKQADQSGLSALILRPAGEVPSCVKFQSPWETPTTNQLELPDTYCPASICLQDTALLRAIGPRQAHQMLLVRISHYLHPACPQNQSLIQDTTAVDCRQIPVGRSLAIPSTSIENHNNF